MLLGLCLAALYVIWGSTYLAIRFSIETIPPFTMAGVRFLIAGALLFLLARLRGEPAPDRRNWGAAAVVGTLLLVGGNGGVVWAEQRIDSGLAALLVTTMPFWLVLITWLMPQGKAPTARTLVGIAIGFSGVCLLVAPGSSGALHVDPLGALVVGLSAVSWATGSVLSRRLPLPNSPVLSTALQMLSVGAVLLQQNVAFGEPAHFHPANVSLRSLLALAYLIVFGALVAYTAFVWLIRNAPPAIASTYAYVNPLVAVFLGWAIAGEPLSPRILFAALVIVTGVVIVSLPARKARPREEHSAAPVEKAATA